MLRLDTFQNRSGLWALALTILGLLLRLFQLGEWSFWHDEALTVLLAQKPIPELVAITAADVHPPLYYLVVKLFLLFGQSETLARLPSVIFGAGSIYLLYLLGRDLFEATVGLVGAFIMTISPLQLFYAQEARMYTQLIFLTILAGWLLFRALRTENWIDWLLFSVVITLAAYTTYFAFPVVAAMALYIILVEKRWRSTVFFLISIAVSVLLYIPWLGIFLTQSRAVIDTYWMATPSPLLLFTTVTGFFTSYTLPTWGIAVSLVATLLIVFVTLNEIRHAIREGNRVKPLLWLLLWGLVPLLGTYLVSLIRPIFQLRTVITAAPPFYLMVAWGVASARQRRLNMLLFLPALAMMLISIFNFYFNPAFAKPAWRQAAFYVQTQVRPGDIVLHTSPGSLMPFLAYPHSVRHVLLPGDPELVQENAPSQSIGVAVGGEPQPIEQAVQGYDRAWLVVGLDQAIDYQQQQLAEIEARYRLLEENRINGIYIGTFALDETGVGVEAGR
ncbi:MAG: glycosyltransferase family 39 protein [Anaerolineales bacterium]|nr:glycosyltransferase family 39 protein [Anaerolineales bacterium]